MSRLARWLAADGERLDAWRASAARAGAYMALCLAKSWYRNLDLGKLAAQCDGSEAELQGVEEALRVRASGIVEYAAWDNFVLEQGEDGGVIAEDLRDLQPYDPDGSSDEAARAMESATASSGAAYADSGADGAGSPREGDGATASGAAGDGEATTSGQRPGRPMRPQPRSRCPLCFVLPPEGCNERGPWANAFWNVCIQHYIRIAMCVVLYLCLLIPG